mgnify:FL=1
MGGAYQEDNIHSHFTGNDKGLYATMRGGSIDPSSCLDTCWVDDMAVCAVVSCYLFSWFEVPLRQS